MSTKKTTTTTAAATAEADSALSIVGQPAPALATAPREMSADDVAAFDADGFEAGAAFTTLQPGSIVIGELLGRGSVEITDRKTGEVKPVRTWIVRVGGTVGAIEFLGAHELDRQLQPIMDRVDAGRRHEVKIARGADERVGAVIVSRYRTASRAIVGAVRP